jgi:hypothetical protein
MKDEERWHVGNVFGSLKHAEHAREHSTELLFTLYQEHASPRMATPLIRQRRMPQACSFVPSFLKGVVSTMSEPPKNPLLDERVKPAMLNPVVTHVKASADLQWVLLCVGIALAVFMLALTVGKAP